MKKLQYLLFPAMIVWILSLQSCFLFETITKDEPKPAPMVLDVGSTINNKTIVWVNTADGASWRFLAIGQPSMPMRWSSNASKVLDISCMSTSIGSGKGNTLCIKQQFQSQTHTVSNNAALYCISVGGWLPSSEEAEKIIPFAQKNFWTSNAEKTAKAFYCNMESKKIEKIFADERDAVVTIPVYYLDSEGRVVNP